jgi:hypothetical protein
MIVNLKISKDTLGQGELDQTKYKNRNCFAQSHFDQMSDKEMKH